MTLSSLSVSLCSSLDPNVLWLSFTYSLYSHSKTSAALYPSDFYVQRSRFQSWWRALNKIYFLQASHSDFPVISSQLLYINLLHVLTFENGFVHKISFASGNIYIRIKQWGAVNYTVTMHNMESRTLRGAFNFKLLSCDLELSQKDWSKGFWINIRLFEDELT